MFVSMYMYSCVAWAEVSHSYSVEVKIAFSFISGVCLFVLYVHLKLRFLVSPLILSKSNILEHPIADPQGLQKSIYFRIFVFASHSKASPNVALICLMTHSRDIKTCVLIYVIVTPAPLGAPSAPNIATIAVDVFSGKNIQAFA